MRTRWMLAAVGALLGAGCFSACAAGTETGLGAGGGSATATSASAGGAESGISASVSVSSSASSSVGTGGGGGAGGEGTGGASLCGNGVLDPGETCDGTEFGDLTCESLGLGAGQLQCNSFCGVVAAACTPMEDCSNGSDDDDNGKTDCEDPACATAPPCIESCVSAQPNDPFGFDFGDTTGRPAVHKPSCTATSGPETFYQLTAAKTELLVLKLTSFGPDLSLSVRTTCADDASEIACVNKFGFGDTHAESLTLAVTQGSTYFIMVDGVTNTADDTGSFSLEIDPVPPETKCANFLDDDLNGYTDCDDAACQATAACAAGTVVTGQACTANSQCTANHNDPVCLQSAQGFPGGYCSEFCDVAAQDCAAGNICYGGLGLSKNGVCLESCTVETDCRAGYSCLDRGLSTMVCVLGPENLCNDYADNDNNGKLDCEDPNCQSRPECVPGVKGVGQPCTLNTDCFANENNPICLDEAHEGYPGGYCSHFCDLTDATSCGATALCVPEGPMGQGVCWSTCATAAQCRTGYSCMDFMFTKNVCTF